MAGDMYKSFMPWPDKIEAWRLLEAFRVRVISTFMSANPVDLSPSFTHRVDLLALHMLISSVLLDLGEHMHEERVHLPRHCACGVV